MIWDSYPIEKDGRTHHVAWRVDLFEGAPDRTRPVRIDVILTLNAPDGDGLPDDAENAQLKELREALEYDIIEACDARYALRVTGGGRQVHTFYAPKAKGFFRKKRTPDLAVAAAKALAEEFPSHPARVEHAEDEEWQRFLDAFPSTDPMQWFADARMVGQLAQAGDDLSGPREVAHWILFPDESAREQGAEAASAEGFEVLERFPVEDAPEHGFALTVRRVEPSVELMVLHPAVLTLAKIAEGLGGVHHRWEVAPSAHAPAAAAGDDDEAASALAGLGAPKDAMSAGRSTNALGALGGMANAASRVDEERS
ncbi:MAG: DUF695 domain-containing protein [Deltaproteobacteria bacterium]|nr:MAG: DUF695 domain-containing protein [Deltaproteobacteria bacterium]